VARCHNFRLGQCSGMTPERRRSPRTTLRTLGTGWRTLAGPVFRIWGKRTVVRAALVLLVAAAALAGGESFLPGAAAGAHRSAAHAWEDAASPTWSPDGKQIVFAYYRYPNEDHYLAGSPSRFRIVRTSSKPGGAIHTVHAGTDSDDAPVWNPMGWTAGGRILFSKNDFLPNSSAVTESALFSVGVHGGAASELPFSICAADEGQVCQWCAYLSDFGPPPDCDAASFILSPDREVAAVNLTGFGDNPIEGIGLAAVGSRAPALLATPLLTYNDVALAFSPDGKQLVFSHQPNNGVPGPSTVMAIPLNGGGPVPLAQSGIPGAALVPNDVRQLTWSPNGRWLAYIEYGSRNLEVVPTAGTSPPRTLATGIASRDFGVDNDFSWSPNSKLIAYNCCSEQPRQLVTVRPDGRNRADVLKHHPVTYSTLFATDGGPQWSPDSSRLVFLAHATGHRPIHVWTIRASGHRLTRIG
jgi:WD40-like Beta Propeller Repeat